MVEDSTEYPTSQKITFSFDYHKQHLKHSSVELYQALRTMTWRAKLTPLSTDQGLKELIDN